MNHIMVDIETLGRSPDAVIVQIAAVQFNPITGETGDEFCINVDAADSQKYGLKIYAETILFWLEQSREAHQSVFYGAKSQLKTALLELTDFIISVEFETKEKAIIWANSPSFDLEILKNAYRATQLKEVWEFRNERDFRTISKLFPIIIEAHERTGIAHDAISDCRNQIAILSKCFLRIFTPNTEGVPLEEKLDDFQKLLYQKVKNTEGVDFEEMSDEIFLKKLDEANEFLRRAGVPSFDETDDKDFRAGYELAQLLEQYPREYCGCKADCAACIQYAVTVLSDETAKEIPLRFRIM